MDLPAIRSRLADANGRLYWRSLGELADTPEFREYLQREFPEQASEWNDPKGRRSFLKLMSASLALAGVGACTKQPPEAIVPYVQQPEEIVPGRPLFFASAVPMSGVAVPVLVESHLGRPTKIEGNPEHPASLGATDVLTQAATLTLYDPDRAQTITNRGAIRAWPVFIAAVQSALGSQKARQGAGLRFLTPPITSPSLTEMMATVLRDYPQARWHQFDPVTRVGTAAIASGAEAGSPGQPTAIYHFDKADVVVSLDADFLTCGPASIRYSRDFAARRRSMADGQGMNRLYAIESTPSLTGARADHRLPMRAGDIEAFARQLAGAVGASGTPSPGAPSAETAKWLSAVAKDLQAHRGTSVIVAGEYQPEAVHAIARGMNQALGNVGATVTYGASIEAAPTGQDTSIAELAKAMDAGQVELLVILGGNPVFTAPADLKFGEKLAKVGLAVYHGLYVDETAYLCHWHIPEAHALESWGDARAYDGTVTLMQPLIAPLYEGRSVHEVLAAFTAQPDRRGDAIVKEYWARAFASGQGGWTLRDADGEPFRNTDAFWRRALHDGFIWGTAVTQGAPATALTPAPAGAAAATGSAADTTATGAAAAAATAAGASSPGAAPEAGGGSGASASAPGATPGAGGRGPTAQSVASVATGEGAPTAAQQDNRSAALPSVQAPPPPGSTAAGDAAGAPQAATPAGQPGTPSPEPGAPPSGGEGDLEIIFRPDPTIWDGRFANNGWLQELPKPFTKLTWDPTAWVSPRLATERDLRNGDIIELRYRGATTRLPVFIVPGHPARSVTVFFGYGRTRAGRVGNAVSEGERFNAFLLRTSDAPWFGSGLAISKTGENYPLATTQQHFAMEGRAPVRVATVDAYKAKPSIIHEMGHTPPRTLTLYPEHEYNGYKWGMAIDLTTCTGCSACTIACQAENNIPVVGKAQVLRSREMHWIRVDQYYAGDPSDEATLEAFNQPVPCMQCENAPCEVVCPVAATAHSAEGLNDMVYNRCVGTRYCSNNCPYKVRRFNFLLYSDWTTESLEPLRNPDVTVRSRGVMEKCTYCVQRINHARVDAKREDRRIRDGEVVPACAATCPADAIVFGDMNDPDSRVNKLKAQERNYGVLEDLNTRPRTTYLADIRNPNPELAAHAPVNQAGH